MENFKENRKELDEELERFITLLNQLLPHYHFLLKKKDLSEEELNKLGEIEHYLIGEFKNNGDQGNLNKTFSDNH